MNLNKKNFIILQTVVFIIIPVVIFIYGIIIIPSDSSVIKYLKSALLPFYHSPSNSIEIPTDLRDLFFYSNIYSIWNLIFIPVLSIIGKNRFQKTGSLRILHGLAVIVFFSTLMVLPITIFRNYEKYTDYKFYISISLSIIKLIGSYLLVTYASKKITVLTLSSKTDTIEQPKSTRFLNLLLDQLFMYYLALNFMRTTTFFVTSFGFPHGMSLLWYLQGPVILLSIIYYAISEGIFKTTFGKIITSSTIINDEGKIISFGTAILRTIGRLIPFDSLSFFFANRGWHDYTFTRTYVVKAFYRKEE